MNTRYDLDLCKYAMAEKGWEQYDVALQSKLSKAVVSKFFRGESVRNRTAFKIVEALGLEMGQVLLRTTVEVG